MIIHPPYLPPPSHPPKKKENSYMYSPLYHSKSDFTEDKMIGPHWLSLYVCKKYSHYIIGNQHFWL